MNYFFKFLLPQLYLHIVGVPVKDGTKNGMKRQVGKSTIFTKESLREI